MGLSLSSPSRRIHPHHRHRPATDVAIRNDLNCCGLHLAKYPISIQDSKKYVLIAVSNNGYALKYASRRLRDDYTIVKIAVSRYGAALRYASPRLKNDPSIVATAIRQMAFSIVFASPELRARPEIVALAREFGFDFFKNNGIKIYPLENCILCLNENPNIVFLPCGHTAICSRPSCYNDFIQKFIECPICRARIFSCIEREKIVSIPIHE
jgi:hypothetical protein